MNIKKCVIIIFLLIIPFLIFTEEKLNIITVPSGAEVFHNGKQIGTTPLTISKSTKEIPIFNNPEKLYNLIIYKEFFESEIVSISMNKIKEREIKIELNYLKRLPLYNGIFQKGYTLNFFNLLTKTSNHDILKLKNEIYAKYGKKIDLEFKSVIEKSFWYKENPFFSDDFYDEYDITNLEILNSLETVTKEDTALADIIIKTSKYIDYINNLAVIFIDHLNVIISPQDFSEEYATLPIHSNSNLNWRIVNGVTYLWNIEENSLFRMIFNSDASEIEKFENISYKLQQYE